MPAAAEYASRISALGWSDLRNLWDAIEHRDTPGWEPGRAFEYLVLRACQLDGAQVRWPYPVTLSGEEVEQIDGAVHCAGLFCLVESKDLATNVGVGPIAKIRNQLLRRPAGSVGLVFSSKGFTDSAIILARFAVPQAILLWDGAEIEYALRNEQICELLASKYRICVEFGLPDYNVRLRDFP
jgi:hypothetical protein